MEQRCSSIRPRVAWLTRHNSWSCSPWWIKNKNNRLLRESRPIWGHCKYMHSYSLEHFPFCPCLIRGWMRLIWFWACCKCLYLQEVEDCSSLFSQSPGPQGSGWFFEGSVSWNSTSQVKKFEGKFFLFSILSCIYTNKNQLQDLLEKSLGNYFRLHLILQYVYLKSTG